MKEVVTGAVVEVGGSRFPPADVQTAFAQYGIGGGAATDGGLTAPAFDSVLKAFDVQTAFT